MATMKRPPMIALQDAKFCRPTEITPDICITSSAQYLQTSMAYPQQFTVWEDELLEWLMPRATGYLWNGKLNCMMRGWDDLMRWFSRSPASVNLCTQAHAFMATGIRRSWVAFAAHLMQSPYTRYMVMQLVSCVLGNERDPARVYLDILAHADNPTTDDSDFHNFMGALCDIVLLCTRHHDQFRRCELEDLVRVGNIAPHNEVARRVLDQIK